MTDETTRYMGQVDGDLGNYDWPITADVTKGYVGITQRRENGGVEERVLLSPAQWHAVVTFVRRHLRKKP